MTHGIKLSVAVPVPSIAATAMPCGKQGRLAQQD
jgi:hypothetical protein